MPLYICANRQGSIAEDVKSAIAEDLTRIHCDVTDAPPTFVHVFFRDLPDEAPVKCALVGSIRAGRTEEQRGQIHLQMREAVAGHTGLALESISMESSDLPASWIMEGGDILPEPGEEAAWLEKHNAANA